MNTQELEEMPAVELAGCIGQLHGLMAATHATLLEFIAAYDRQEAWRVDGAASMAGWLEATLGIFPATARKWVATARALENLPAIHAAHLAGRMSTEQVVAAAEVATPETDVALAEEVPQRSVGWLNDTLRAARLRRQAEPDQRRRRALWWTTGDDMMRMTARLPHEEGAVVAKALQRIADGYGPDPATGMYEPGPARHADALVELASARLSEDSDADRATVVVHVDADVLVGGQGTALLEQGPALPVPVVRRLACDARIELSIEGPNGPLGIGRASRKVPAWLSRVLRHRDGGCRFPGCGRRRYVHAHHIHHWADGGPTEDGNLVLLCGRHHTLVHEGGWSINGEPNGDIVFIRPDGRPLRTGPPAIGAEVSERLFSWGLLCADTS